MRQNRRNISLHSAVKESDDVLGLLFLSAWMYCMYRINRKWNLSLSWLVTGMMGWIGLSFVVVGCGQTDPLDSKPPLCFSASDCGSGQDCVHSVCAPVLKGTLPPTPPLDAGSPTDIPPQDNPPPPPDEPDCVPTGKEVCDGIDNNCDGTIDENLTRDCKAPNAKGECQAGTQTCKDGTFSPCQPGQPTPEICDGKDSDCDGRVDNIAPTPCFEGNKGQANRGTCKEGTTKCQQGAVRCVGQVLPKADVCGDQLDTNCDGRVDETCGDPQNLWVYDGSSKPTVQVGFDQGYAQKNSIGASYYKLHSNTANCQKRVLFVTPISPSRRTDEPLAVGYDCSGDWFKIYFVHYTTLVKDPFYKSDHKLPSFHAVSPRSGSWGRIICNRSGRCSPSFTDGDERPATTGQSGGMVNIQFPAGSKYCAKAGQPVFAMPYADITPGYVIGRSMGQNVCVFQGYSVLGKTDARSFDFWIPNPEKQAWATYDRLGKIVAENNYGDKANSWPVSAGSTSHATTVRFGSHARDKLVVLASPYLDGTKSPVLSALGTSIQVTSDGKSISSLITRTYGSQTNGVKFTTSPQFFSVLLLHNP